MTSLEIQFALKKRGIKQKTIAEELSLSAMQISRVIRRLGVSDRVMRHVAKEIGLDHRKVWPEHYLQSLRRKNFKNCKNVDCY